MEQQPQPPPPELPHSTEHIPHSMMRLLRMMRATPEDLGIETPELSQDEEDNS